TGAAIAASLAPLGVGTETDGSVLCPSSMNGLVGVKPTVGLVSRDGIIPISGTQDTAGPMTRSVADAALLLQVLATADTAEPAAAFRPKDAVDYLAALKPGALRGRRIGVLRQSMGDHPAIDAAAEAAYAVLRKSGATLVDVQIATWGQWGDAEYTLMLVEFRQGLEDYLRRADSPFDGLAALADWNRANAARVMPWFGQEIFEKTLALDPRDEAAYRNARATAMRLAWEEGLRPLFEQQGFDALVGPTNGPAWPIDLVLGDPPGNSAYGIAAVAGTPSVTVPMGALGELPLGLAFLGKPWGEAELLAMAADFEERTRARRAPRYLPTVDPDHIP
ncbi:MAG: amidase family protein, partial [Gammaproteobacteria bacterium]